MPKVPCACGCGTLIPPINKKLRPATYKHGHQPGGEATRFKLGNDGRVGVEARRAQGKLNGPGSARWNGGEWRVKGGYVRRTITPEQAAMWPTALSHGKGWSIPRSHYVWNLAHPEDVVADGYEVHHDNLVRDDDRIENLVKLTRAEHVALHTARGWHKGPRRTKKTACPAGHPYAQYRRTSANGRHAWCIECGRLKMAARREAARSAAAPS